MGGTNTAKIEILKNELEMWDSFLKNDDLDYLKLKFGSNECLCTYYADFDDGYRFSIRIASQKPKDKTIYCYGVLTDADGVEVETTQIKRKLSGKWELYRKIGRSKEWYNVDVVDSISNEMMTENYCDDCDDVLHAVFDSTDFWNFKVGRICCACGYVVKPCNECFGSKYHGQCGNCPWSNAKIVGAMTDKEYMLWCRKNEPDTYEMFKGDSNGDYYHKVIAEIEKELKDEAGTD